MNAQIKMLVWKQWRERRGQLLLCFCTVLACLVAALVWSQVMATRVHRLDRFPWEIMGWLYCVLMPLLVAMRTSCGETTDHTRQFSLTLPVRRQWQNLVRLVGGGIVLLMPIAVVLMLIDAFPAALDARPVPAVARSAAETSPWLNAAILTTATIGGYLQLAVLGTFARSENRLALVGAVWTVVWLFAGLVNEAHLNASLLESVSPQALSIVTAFAAPERLVPPPGFVNHVCAAIEGNLVAIVLLAAWFTWSHGRPANQSAARPLWKRASGILGRPLRAFSWQPSERMRRRFRQAMESPRWKRAGAWLADRLPAWRVGLPERIRTTRWGALAWLAMRQSLPLCLAAIAISLVLTAIMLIVVCLEPHRTLDRSWTAIAGGYAMITMFVGILWASVVGVGSMSDELDGRSADFWRTRPIPFWRLFTIKFAVGLVAVILVLDGPMALLNGLGAAAETPSMAFLNWVSIGCLMPMHAAMFAVALAWACSLRRLALGALGALACFSAAALATLSLPAIKWLSPWAVYDAFEIDLAKGQSPDVWASGYPVMVAVFLLVTAASYLIAGFALNAYQPHGRLR